MQIVGYFTRGNREYVAFIRDKGQPWKIEVTDGFHDNEMMPRGDTSNLKKYRQVEKGDVNLDKIISRMRGARPWHPLLKILRREADI
ncbi:MAG: hypothetical protein NC293_09020 [Roseburia sp.]|nr:hypothetical protein [Roseburia sp.]